MEGRDLREAQLSGPPEAGPAGPGLAGAALAGALFGALATLAVGLLVRVAAPPLGAPEAAGWLPRFMRAGHWLAVPLTCSAAAVLLRWPKARRRSDRTAIVMLALPLVLGGALLVVRPNPEEDRVPRTVREKTRAALRWSYRSPATVARIVPLARDPDLTVREQAVLALSRNLVVDDIQRANARRPPRFERLAVVDSLRVALANAAHDPVEIVRVVAARGLWDAPRVFGPQPAAAETLIAVLDRATALDRLERLSWIALDAAAGPPDSALKAAAVRFAHATPDTALASAARRAGAF